MEVARKKAEQEAAQRRQDEERRAADQAAKAAEAERKAAEAKQRADDAARNKAAAEAAALRQESDAKARQAEEERRKADAAAAQEATCQQEQHTFDQLVAKGSEGTGLDDLRSFAKTVTCPRIGGVVVATLEKFTAAAHKQTATAPNSLELLRAAQSQLSRLGCFEGKIDGSLTTTQDALARYRANKKGKTSGSDITQAVVDDLTSQSGRVCPLNCPSDQTAKGEVCVAKAKPAEPATASRHKDVDTASRHKDEDTASRRKPAAPREAQHVQSRPEVQQQAAARPSYGGGGGGGAHTMVGVGF